MRLTLRTLLAYLDDILPPAQAKEIGEKIADSNYASTLVDRIREVLRRRRLTAPEMNGDSSALDANLSAEYLDNTLSPDKVAEVEKECLESDVKLAEVAACHQILTLVLGEPVEVRPESRARMYALNPIGKKDGVARSERPTAAQVAAAAQAGSVPPVDVKPSTFVDRRPREVPEYLKEAPLWRRLALPATFAAIAAVWLTMIALDERSNPIKWFFPATTEVTPDRPIKVNQPQPPGDETDSGDAVAINENDPNSAEAVAPAVTAVPTDKPPADVAPAIENPTEVAVVEPNAANGAPPADNVPPGPVEAVHPTTAAPMEQPVNPPPVLPEPVILAAPSVTYDPDETGVLLRHDAGRKDWFVVRPRAEIRQNEEIASPEPFSALLQIDEAKVRARLVPHTRAVLLPPSTQVGFGFAVQRGRMIFSTMDERGSADQPPDIKFSLLIGKTLWHIQLAAWNTVCAVEVDPVRPDRFEQELGDKNYRARLYISSGVIRLAQGDQWSAPLNAVSTISLSPGTEALVEPLAAVPSWIGGEERRTPTTVRFATQFEKKFDFNEGMSVGVPAAIKDDSRRSKISLWAVQCLALTSNLDELVTALAPNTPEDARMAAMDGIRDLLGQSPDARVVLIEQLKRSFPASDSETMYRLLWGYNENDARDPTTSKQLVEWLGHNQVAIRELAFYYITQLTNRRYDYRPLDPQPQRAAAVGRWNRHLTEEGALAK